MQGDNIVLKGTLCILDDFRISFSEIISQLNFVMVFLYLEGNNMLIKNISEMVVFISCSIPLGFVQRRFYPFSILGRAVDQSAVHFIHY